MKLNLVSQNRRTWAASPTSAAASEIVRKASGPLSANLYLFLQRLIDACFQELRRPEADHPARRNRRRCARLRIATHPLTFGAHLEDAKARQFDGFAPLHGFGHQVERAFDETGAILS